MNLAHYQPKNRLQTPYLFTGLLDGSLLIDLQVLKG
jgi:hypothetical protein